MWECGRTEEPHLLASGSLERLLENITFVNTCARFRYHHHLLPITAPATLSPPPPTRNIRCAILLRAVTLAPWHQLQHPRRDLRKAGCTRQQRQASLRSTPTAHGPSLGAGLREMRLK